MAFLFNIESEPFHRFLWYWGSASIFFAVGMHVLKMLPMSERSPSEALNYLGTIDKRTGWVIMEIPVLVVVIASYVLAGGQLDISAIMVGVFVLHYVNRALIYPWRLKVDGKVMPVHSMLSSIIFYIVNSYLIGYYFGALRSYETDWLLDPRFLAGITLFFAGLAINIHSDNILLNLRGPGETGYKIPRGGLFKYVSCPHYFGEILEWAGFALLTWSSVGLVYAIWVTLPLIAQSIGIHRWNRETFGDDYPAERKAIIPGLI